MSSAEEAAKCIHHLHRTELHGRMISVEKVGRINIYKYTGFPQGLEIMENLENHQKKVHAWKNHGI